MSTKIERTEERRIYSNAFYEVFDDVVRFPSGKVGNYFRLKNRVNNLGSVAIPRLADGRLLLLKCFRYAADRQLLEFPRGLGEFGETGKQIAQRELLEETGLESEDWIFLGSFFPNGAVFEEEVEVWLAKKAVAAGRPVEPDEGFVEQAKVTELELRKLVGAGELQDGFSLSALALYREWQDPIDG